MTITALVRGSQPDPYRVTFSIGPGKISAVCTCAAGLEGQSCKHRLSILAGDYSAVVDPNPTALDMVRAALPGTDLQRSIDGVAQADRELALAKSRLSKAKKALSTAMRD